MTKMIPIVFAGLSLSAGLVWAEPPIFEARIVAQFETFDARQGVAVDAHHFYAVNNFRITKHDKKSGEPLLQWDGDPESAEPLIHLNSGMVFDGKLYAAHSNYPSWPMTSSLETWDTKTMAHIGTHSFGVRLGSFAWIDRFEDSWWGAFANYDRVQQGMRHPYGETRNTVVVKFDAQFNVVQNWTIPVEILSRMTPMSNSGGSWGPDGMLYLTGHDHPEIYVMAIPDRGSELDWRATIHVPSFNGQGIAWNRSGDSNELWGILKSDRRVFRIEMPEIANKLKPTNTDYLRNPGQFNTQ